VTAEKSLTSSDALIKCKLFVAERVKHRGLLNAMWGGLLLKISVIIAAFSDRSRRLNSAGINVNIVASNQKNSDEDVA
jgi:hypothetical protein